MAWSNGYRWAWSLAVGVMVVAGFASSAGAEGVLVVSDAGVEAEPGDDGATAKIQVSNSGSDPVTVSVAPVDAVVAERCDVALSEQTVPGEDLASITLTFPASCPLDDGLRLEVTARIGREVVGTDELTVTEKEDETDEWARFPMLALVAGLLGLATVVIGVAVGVDRGRQALVDAAVDGVDAAVSAAADAARAFTIALGASSRALQLRSDAAKDAEPEARALAVVKVAAEVDRTVVASAAASQALNDALAGGVHARLGHRQVASRPNLEGPIHLGNAVRGCVEAARWAIHSAIAAVHAADSLVAVAATAGAEDRAAASAKAAEVRSALVLLLDSAQPHFGAMLEQSVDDADEAVADIERELADPVTLDFTGPRAAVQTSLAIANDYVALGLDADQARQALRLSLASQEISGDAPQARSERPRAKAAEDASLEMAAVALRVSSALAAVRSSLPDVAEDVRSNGDGHWRQRAEGEIGVARDAVERARRLLDEASWLLRPAAPGDAAAPVVEHPVWRSLQTLKAGWSFKDSWATNASLGVATLATLVSSSDAVSSVLGSKQADWLAVFTTVSLVAAALVGFASLVSITVTTREDKPFVLGVATAALLTMTGVFLQVGIIGVGVVDMADGRVIVLVALGLMAAIAVPLTFVYGIESLARLVADLPPPSEPPKPSDAEKAAVVVAASIDRLALSCPPRSGVAASGSSEASPPSPALPGPGGSRPGSPPAVESALTDYGIDWGSLLGLGVTTRSIARTRPGPAAGFALANQELVYERPSGLPAEVPLLTRAVAVPMRTFDVSYTEPPAVDVTPRATML